ncbi:MAG: type IX secretion system membrane protein PorP/SprF [Bacteroidales bacterium]|nr:type IX secretion system membrane protein PorP/SprF [Bacteroidales bacterium]
MRKLYIFFILVAFPYFLFSQQEAQFSHNMFNNMAINPAYAGMKDAICLTGLVRQQWVGFTDAEGNKGAPQTNLISVDGKVKFLRGGLGLTVMSDKLGFENNIGVKFGYSYHLHLGPGRLGIGANIGFLNKKIDFSKFKPIDLTDPLLQSQNVETTMITDVSFGAFYQIPKKLYFGISTSQLLQSDGSLQTSTASLDLKRHYYITGGYFYPLPMNPNYELFPSVLVKTDGASAQFDINTLLRYNNQFWGGVSYRAQDAVVVLLGASFKDFVLGYAYDITTSEIGKSKRSSGSHEIMLGYCFTVKVERIPQSYRNVRFL